MGRPKGDQERGMLRLVKLVCQLSNRPGHRYCNASSKFLAERLDCSQRTISRWMTMARNRGLLQVFVRRKKVGGDRRSWLTQRYCRPISETTKPTWAPVFCSAKTVRRSGTENEKKASVGTSWAKPFYGEDDEHPLAVASSLAARVESLKNRPRPVYSNPIAELESRSRLWAHEVSQSTGAPSPYRRE
jgi:hypothetical protein